MGLLGNFKSRGADYLSSLQSNTDGNFYTSFAKKQIWFGQM